MPSLHAAAADCLAASDPDEKLRLTHAAAAAFRRGELTVPASAPPPSPIRAPGRPARPQLISPRDLPQRGLGSPQGRAAFLHAVAHIEFNAVNLAWDAVYRFRGMPAAFYADWVGVADDEARHFSLLQQRLASLGQAYGDFDAHNGLWEMAEQTADSCLRRMALVPRVLEARGLDVTPGMITRLRQAGDADSADVLALILDEEVAHVAAGTRWFHWCCEREGLAPGREFIRLVREVARGSLRGPFNRAARREAGFDDFEMAELESMEPAR
ncbi:ferritin-like domain-containing protein [Arenimonas sp. MALMAid1274]|uniref:ferritin-like domain-containing protein n=1 Tax=Arenimonas sp. MALMAid1274 TaxID=3411630 RepID=UPI003BA1570D